MRPVVFVLVLKENAVVALALVGNVFGIVKTCFDLTWEFSVINIQIFFVFFANKMALYYCTAFFTIGQTNMGKSHVKGMQQLVRKF